MKKRLVVLAIAALVAVVPLTAQPNKTSGHEQQPTKQSQPSVVASMPEKNDSGDQDKGKASPNPPNWYAAFENPDGALVIVGLITFVVIGWQSMETRKAAKGALLNAQSLITAERPWLVAHFIQDGSVQFPKNGRMKFRCEIKNVGKTPAILSDVSARAVFNTDAVPLPDEPDYGYADPLDQRILIPGATYFFWADWYEWKNGRYFLLEKTDPLKMVDLLVGFGCIRYRDTFGETAEHVTRFCDCATIGGTQVSGPFSPWDSAPPEYTKCT